MSESKKKYSANNTYHILKNSNVKIESLAQISLDYLECNSKKGFKMLKLPEALRGREDPEY